MAVQNRADLQTTINTNLGDFSTILPNEHRAVETNLLDSSLNLLDDYESIDFTPTLIDISGLTTYSIGSVLLSRVTRIRQLIFLQIRIEGINDTGVGFGQVRLGNIPLISRNQPGYFSTMKVLRFGNDTISFTSICAEMSAGNDYIRFRIQNGASTSANASILSSVGFTNDVIWVSGWYQGNNI